MIATFAIPRVSWKAGTPGSSPDFLVVGVPEASGKSLPELPKGAEAGNDVIAKGDFRGKRHEIALVYPGAAGPGRLLLIGLGDPSSIDAGTWRTAAARAAREAKERRVGALTFMLEHDAAPDAITACVQGAILGGAKRNISETAPAIELIAVHGGEGGDAAVEAGIHLAEATLHARMLVTEPPNRLTPAALAEAALELQSDGAEVTVLDKPAIEKEGLHSLAAVGQGSANEPRFIVARFDGAGGEGPRIVLVGKGITFDSGGLSLKSADRMVNMKYDMAGSAAVLGAFRSAVRMKLPLDLAAVVPAAENMPSAVAYRPGDVIDSYSGQTIEVDNTDAEGRLVLADGLAWAEKNLEPDEMIDAATLTGACRIALGRHAAGLFSNDHAFAARLMQAGRYSGERVWQLPVWDAYDRELDSDVAHMKNVGKAGPGGGASVAASFLKRFVKETLWAHLDIAGMAWAASPGELSGKGPTGFGASLLLTYLMERSGRSAT